MKTFRVHCWIDVKADDAEFAKTVTQVRLSLLVKDVESFSRAGIPGTPVDLEAKIGRRR